MCADNNVFAFVCMWIFRNSSKVGDKEKLILIASNTTEQAAALLKDVKRQLTEIAADLIQCAPDEAIRKIIQYANMYPFFQFAVESNNFQELMVNDLRRRLRLNGHKFKVHALSHNSQKQARICSLEPSITQGLVHFIRKQNELISQLTQFPMAKNDDGPDALQMAVELARKPVRVACAGLKAIKKYQLLNG